jgi:Xaa-Pro aminopeptidase
MSFITEIQLPEFGREETRPDIPVQVYQKRFEKILGRMEQDRIDILVVYADREHSANIAYLTGFDPRFEEALLLLAVNGERLLLLGNECMGYLPDAELVPQVEMFQEFSLLGQARDESRSLRTIFEEFGVGIGKRIGCIGWKHFQSELIEGGRLALEIPAYLVDCLRELAGDATNVFNANDILMGVEHGLRILNEPEQIAFFEHAAGVTSSGVLALLRHIEEGVEERELERYLDSQGLPLSCHRMVSFGEKAKRGLSSASNNAAAKGDTFTTAFGVTGALNCRAGCIANDQSDLPADLAEFFPEFVANFFDVVARWYETVRVGVTGGEVFAAVESVRDDKLYRFAVNPGHYIHLDEWVNSPFSEGSQITLKSGAALQMDIIPVSNGPFCYANMEDGIVLADANLRETLSDRYPAMWKRIQSRREFMLEAIGIQIDESVLPLSNMPGWLPPYALNLDQAMLQSEP